MRRLATTAMEPGKMMTYVEEDIVHIATAKELLCDGIAMDVKIVTGRSPQMTQPSKMKIYGQTISTADSRPYVVREHKFETEAEAAAYALGVNDGAYETDPDFDDVSGVVSSEPAEDEP